MLARRQEVMQALHLPNCLCRSVDVTDLTAMQAAIREAESQRQKQEDARKARQKKLGSPT